PALALLFFFSSRRRHTRFSRDWSSDVCSSDLNTQGAGGRGSGGNRLANRRADDQLAAKGAEPAAQGQRQAGADDVGRLSDRGAVDRKSVVEGKRLRRGGRRGYRRDRPSTPRAH